MIFQLNEIVSLLKPFRLVGFFIWLSFIFLLGMQYQKTMLIERSTKEITSNNTDISNSVQMRCKNYGNKPPDELLEKYTVKKYDGILSISKSQLNDTSRESELIMLNKKYFSNLDGYDPSAKYPTLEPGWVLLLPPKSVKKTSGYISIAEGEVAKSTDSTIYLRTYSGDYISNPSRPGYRVYINSETTFNDGEIKVGDCLKILVDSPPNYLASIAISIYHQK